jgi:hypothetical protein
LNGRVDKNTHKKVGVRRILQREAELVDVLCNFCAEFGICLGDPRPLTLHCSWEDEWSDDRKPLKKADQIEEICRRLFFFFFLRDVFVFLKSRV